MRPPPWPKEREDRLCVLWLLGWSGSKIGKELGVSRSAVMGKVGRLNLPTRSGEPRERGPGVRRRRAVERWRGRAA